MSERDDERAAVVRWLRADAKDSAEQARMHPSPTENRLRLEGMQMCSATAASAIERGVHVPVHKPAPAVTHGEPFVRFEVIMRAAERLAPMASVTMHAVPGDTVMAKAGPHVMFSTDEYTAGWLLARRVAECLSAQLDHDAELLRALREEIARAEAAVGGPLRDPF